MDLFYALLCFVVICWIVLVFNPRPKNFPPGPTWLPVFGNLLLVHRLKAKFGYFYLVWEELTKRYGPIVGLKLGGDRIVLCSGYDLVKSVYNMEECDGKSEGFVFKIRTYGERLGIAFNDGPTCMKTRNFVMKTLREIGSGKDRGQELIIYEATQFIDFLKELCDNENKAYSPNNLGTLFRLSVLNSQWALISGKQFAMDDARLIDLLKLVSDFFQSFDFSGGIVNHFPWIRFIAPELSGYNKMAGVVLPLQKFCEKAVEDHFENFDPEAFEQTNFIDAYIAMIKKSEQPDPVFNKKQLVCVLMDLFMAGPETISTAMGFMLQYLVQYPHTQVKLQEEIDSIIGRARMPNLADMEMMPYWKAFVTESLRFCSMVPTSMPHRAMVDIELFGYKIPKDTILLMSNYGVHMDKDHWGDPEVFRPERFLDHTGKKFIKDDWVMSFGLGKRRCFGENIARQTIFIFLTATLQNFNVTFPRDAELMDLKPIEGITLSPQEFPGVIKVRD